MNAFPDQLARALLPFAAAIAAGVVLCTAGDDVLLHDLQCRAFTGAVSGNDPDVRVSLSLCRDGDTLDGQLMWNGRSGLSVRDVEGAVLPDGTVLLADTRVVLDAPNPGWIFCPVDQYALTWSPASHELTGSYVSKSCHDTAGVWLAAAR